MPDVVVAMLHPAHVARPMFVEAVPAAIETDSSRIAEVEATTVRHGTRGVKYRLVDVSAPKAAVTRHDDAMQKLYSSGDDKWADMDACCVAKTARGCW